MLHDASHASLASSRKPLEKTAVIVMDAKTAPKAGTATIRQAHRAKPALRAVTKTSLGQTPQSAKHAHATLTHPAKPSHSAFHVRTKPLPLRKAVL